KHHAREIHGQRELGDRLLHIAGRKQPCELLGKDDSEDRYDDENNKGYGTGTGEEGTSCLITSLGQPLAQYRNEGARHGTLSTQLAEGVGNRQSNPEGIGLSASEPRCDHRIASESEDAREQCSSADNSGTSDDFLTLLGAPRFPRWGDG